MNAPKSCIFLFVLLFSLAGCQPKEGTSDTTPQKPETNLTEVKPTKEPEPLTIVEPALFEGMIIGDKVRMRSDSSTSSEIVGELNTTDPVRIHARTVNRYNLGQSGYCQEYGYHWYQLSNQQGDKGWVYGRFVYQSTSASEAAETGDGASNIQPLMGGWNIELGGKMYQMQFFRSLGIGASDAYGLTGCDIDLYPILLERERNTALFFYNKNDAFGSLGYHIHEDDLGRIYFTYESEGGRAAVEDMYLSDHADGETVNMELSIGLQDAGGTSYLSFLVGEQIRLHSFRYDAVFMYD